MHCTACPNSLQRAVPLQRNDWHWCLVGIVPSSSRPTRAQLRHSALLSRGRVSTRLGRACSDQACEMC
eukprot:14922312-Alexandrium_andersonii.AAC.1